MVADQRRGNMSRNDETGPKREVAKQAVEGLDVAVQRLQTHFLHDSLPATL